MYTVISKPVEGRHSGKRLALDGLFVDFEAERLMMVQPTFQPTFQPTLLDDLNCYLDRGRMG